MKRGIWRKLVSAALAVGMVLTCAATSVLAAEPDSVQEFRQGTVKMAGQADFNGLGLMMVLKDNGDLWALGNLSFLGKDAPYDEIKTIDRGDEKETYYYCTTPKKIMTNISAFGLDGGEISVIKNDSSLWIASCEIGDKEKPFILTKYMDNLMPSNTSTVEGSPNIAVKADCSLWTWGSDFCGQLGIGRNYTKPKDDKWYVHYAKEPVKVMDNAKKALSDGQYCIALKDDGSVWCWGDNQTGQVGKGLDRFVSLPQKVMDGAKDIAVGYDCSFVIKEDNSLWFWGAFIPSDNPIIEPAPIKLMEDVEKVTTSPGCILVLKTDGTVWAIGNNYAGKLGDGGERIPDTATPYKDPPRKTLLKDVKDVYLGNDLGFAIKNDGSLWAFGDNVFRNSNGFFSYEDTPKITYFASEDNGRTPVQIVGEVKTQPVEQPQPATQQATAMPTASKVLVNGKEVSFDAYSIHDNNYFKLRDIANVLNGTGKQFEVTWDGTKNAINLLSGKAYTTVGGELAKGDGSQKPAALNTSKVYLDGKEISLTAYTINDNNYFKLRDLGQTFNFGVGWDGAANTVTIDTSTGYTAE